MKCSKNKKNGITKKNNFFLSFIYLSRNILKNGSISSYILWMIICVSNSALFVLTTEILQMFLDSVVTIQNTKRSLILLASLFLIILLNLILSSLSVWMDGVVEKKSLGGLKVEFLKKVGKTNLLKSENAKYWDEVKRCEEGIQSGVYIVQTIFFMLSWHIPYFLLMSGYLLKVNPLYIVFWGLMVLGIVCIQIIKTRYSMVLTKEISENKRKMAYFSDCVCDAKFCKETRSLEMQPYFANLFENELKKYCQRVKEHSYSTNKKDVLCNLIIVLMYAGIIFILGMDVIKNKISIGVFIAVFNSIDRMIIMVRSLIVSNLGYLTEHIGGVFYYLDFMQKENEKVIELCKNQNDIVLENVGFKYFDKQNWILKNIDLKIENGKTIVVVGENGSGKTTLTKVILGLYESQQGRIFIGNNTVNAKYHFEDATVLFQSFAHYKFSVDDNIAISKARKLFSDCTEFNLFEELHVIQKEKEKMIDCLKFEKAMFQNEKSLLAPEFGGVDLSGGIWQRIGLMRAIYRNFNLIILDEPTSAIDPDEESKLFESFRTIANKKTAIIISHRMGITKLADLIVVLKEGKVVGIGTHDELMMKNEEYQRLWNSQAKFYT